MGRDKKNENANKQRGISTHTPAWGATLPTHFFLVCFVISTHTPAWGATHWQRTAVLQLTFQLTRPRGARRNVFENYSLNLNFNSHARVGRDFCEGHTIQNGVLFQLTRPRGARPSSPNFRASSGTFQLTRPRGARQGNSTHNCVIFQFQLTRPRGARRHFIQQRPAKRTFQLTRPRGARPGRLLDNTFISIISTHTPAWGAT